MGVMVLLILIEWGYVVSMHLTRVEFSHAMHSFDVFVELEAFIVVGMVKASA